MPEVDDKFFEILITYRELNDNNTVSKILIWSLFCIPEVLLFKKKMIAYRCPQNGNIVTKIESTRKIGLVLQWLFKNKLHTDNYKTVIRIGVN